MIMLLAEVEICDISFPAYRSINLIYSCSMITSQLVEIVDVHISIVFNMIRRTAEAGRCMSSVSTVCGMPSMLLLPIMVSGSKTCTHTAQTTKDGTNDYFY
jgi:hypothetical protein